MDRAVRTMIKREELGKEFGVIVVAEGLAEYLPHSYLKAFPEMITDTHRDLPNQPPVNS